jgi:hypothetical protein
MVDVNEYIGARRWQGVHVRLVDCMEFWIMDLYCSHFLMILNLP